MIVTDRNTTKQIQATMHQQKGLLFRRPREKKFYVYSQNSIPGEYQRAITVFYDISEIEPSLLALSQCKKSTVIVCDKCGEYVMRTDSADGQCRECFLQIDMATERAQLSIDTYASARIYSSLYSGGAERMKQWHTKDRASQ